jgi:hypothetical protein
MDKSSLGETAQYDQSSLDWVTAWKAEKLDKVMVVFAELRQQYGGTYNLKLNSSGDGAFIYERFLPLPQLRTAVDFDDDNNDLDYQLARFRERVAALFE